MNIAGRTLAEWESLFLKKLTAADLGDDPAHDVAHFKRVVAAARKIAQQESARLEVVIPAAWLHDLVNVPKNDPRRAQASRLSAAAATDYLASIDYPSEFFADIAHAIEAHSYSAQIEARTLEARIVQDADRLDGLGAIGIARCFSVGALLKRRFYDPADPFGRDRPWDDQVQSLDHFEVKLFKVVETLQTAAGRAEGQSRARFMRGYLKQLETEVLG